MKWIKASERLPDEHKNIVVRIGENKYLSCIVDGFFFINDIAYDEDFIEWLDEQEDEVEIKGQYTMWNEALNSFLTEYTSEYKSFTMDDAIAMMRKRYFVSLRPK